MQKLQTLMEALTSSIDSVHIDRITVLPQSGGSTAAKAATLVEEVRAATGIDIPQVITNFTSTGDS